MNDYKKVLFDVCKFFNKNESTTKEDKLRNEFYSQENKRIKIRKKSSYSEYLKTLDLELHFGQSKFFYIERLAQLTQKTNQFNLTLQRHTLNEIKKKIKNKKNKIYAISLKDKFGEYGTIGLLIFLLILKNLATIENFLMSCRVMGREVEETFLKELIKLINSMKIKS